jgi:uncharacterized protein YodC (DUF2158 family)
MCTEKKIVKGSVVRLKSGSPKFTVAGNFS